MARMGNALGVAWPVGDEGACVVAGVGEHEAGRARCVGGSSLADVMGNSAVASEPEVVVSGRPGVYVAVAQAWGHAVVQISLMQPQRYSWKSLWHIMVRWFRSLVCCGWDFGGGLPATCSAVWVGAWVW